MKPDPATHDTRIPEYGKSPPGAGLPGTGEEGARTDRPNVKAASDIPAERQEMPGTAARPAPEGRMPSPAVLAPLPVLTDLSAAPAAANTAPLNRQPSPLNPSPAPVLPDTLPASPPTPPPDPAPADLLADIAAREADLELRERRFAAREHVLALGLDMDILAHFDYSSDEALRHSLQVAAIAVKASPGIPPAAVPTANRPPAPSFATYLDRARLFLDDPVAYQQMVKETR